MTGAHGRTLEDILHLMVVILVQTMDLLEQSELTVYQLYLRPAASRRDDGLQTQLDSASDWQILQPKLLLPEPVTDMTICQKIPRFCRVGFKFLPQVTNYNAQSGTVRTLLSSPERSADNFMS